MLTLQEIQENLILTYIYRVVLANQRFGFLNLKTYISQEIALQETLKRFTFYTAGD